MENNSKNENIERALLGLIIRKPNLIASTMGVLKVDYFEKENKIIFNEMEKLFNANKKIDEKIILENIEKKFPQKTKFWVEYISDLKLDSGIELNIKDYIDLILEKNQKKQLASALKDSLSLIANENKAETKDLILEIESNIFKVTKDKELKDFEKVSTIVEDFNKKLSIIRQEGYKEGVLTNITSLDYLLGGFKKGELIIIAARPSMGKTAFALQIINNIAHEKKIGLFSLEMPSTSIVQRLISNNAMINQDFIRKYDILNVKDIEKIQLSLEKIKNKSIWIDDTPGLNIGELAWKIRKLDSLVSLDMVIIDYLQLLETVKKSENRQQAISEISRTLKSLARELKIPIIALSQLSRKVETREDKKPMMSDLRESGAIEQDADVILLLYRAKYYNKEEQSKSSIEDLDVIISKNRNGKTGVSKLDINMEFGKITSKPI